ncbi:MAG: metal-sensitive transcriptional regulator [Clostridiaceae bacterium]|jgi:DNA-binding FrmR family transcriptional regulator|nr:metal-sensitive transcriptional regulator [Clostridiaceae bacterium]
MKNRNKTNELINLLKTARGQVDAIIEMVNDGKYCIDILVQLSAVQGIIKKSTITILENQIEKCLFDSTEDAEDRENKIKEIIFALKNCIKA